MNEPATAATPIEQAQEYLASLDGGAAMGGWLVYDYQGMNPAFGDLTGLRGHLTRPVFLFVSPGDAPVLLVSAVDAGQVRGAAVSLGLDVRPYTGLEDAHRLLRAALPAPGVVAMEYSPMRELPRASRVDAGTIELVRSMGVDVVSSAELVQYATQRWTAEGLASHRRAVDALWHIVHEAFTEIGDRLAVGVGEHDIQQLILDRFADAGLSTDYGPVVAANSHASDPHFEPTPEASVRFAPSDWVLIDLWAREHGAESIYADITLTAYVGSRVPPEQQRVFDVVTSARDVAAEFLRERIASGENAQGWEVDQAARAHIADAGYGDYFVHRLGHSLGRQVHAGGVNLDNLETHDTRTFLRGLGFTIEPGVYLPGFGVRSEIDLHVGDAGLEITTPIQRNVVLIG